MSAIFHEAFLLVAAVALLAFASKIVLSTLRLVRKPTPADNLELVKRAVNTGATIGAGFAVAGGLVVVALICH